MLTLFMELTRRQRADLLRTAGEMREQNQEVLEHARENLGRASTPPPQDRR
jgi:hypothetical protein